MAQLNTKQSATSSKNSSKTTVETYPLERAKIKKKVISAMIGWSIFFALLLILVLVIGLGIIGALVLLVLYLIILIIEVIYQRAYYDSYFYDAKEDFLVIKKGAITPTQTMLPYEKLQDVYMDQDLLDRTFNLYDVHVSTATTVSGYEAHIDGLNHENAEAIREIILAKIKSENKTRGK